ncbi:hypothetical protein J5I95_22110 [Candidatus Poribacteria bacterium]|nr:hypothetical protein [Candidatus Poribacteria bacterium]
MLETSNSKFSACKLRQKVVEMLGASPTQYRYLLQTEKLIDKRALKGKNNFGNFSLAAVWFFCFTISISVASIPFFSPIDIFSYALTSITVSMMTIATCMSPYLDILLSPINYPVIAHTPVSSRTYFLVKLTQILKHTIPLLACLNLMPAIGGIWIRADESSQFQYFFPLVYLPVAFMSGYFTVGVMMTFAGYWTKLYTKKTFRNIVKYVQFIFLFFLPLTGILLYYRSPDSLMDQLTSILKWFNALPNAWFAGIVALALGQIERYFLISAGLAIASMLFLVMVPLRSIAKSYSEYLSYLLESGSKQTSKLRVKTPLFARIFRNRAVRAGLCLSFVYIRRDRFLLRHFWGSLIAAITVPVFSNLSLYLMSLGQMWVDDSYPIGLSPGFSEMWVDDSYPIGLSPGFSEMFYIVGFTIVPTFMFLVKSSEHWKASWILMLASLSAPRDLWRGVQAAACLYLIAPWTLLMLCLATVIWGVLGIFYVLPGLIILLNLVIFYPKPRAGLPLAEELVQKRVRLVWWFLPLGILLGKVFPWIPLFAYLIDRWSYYGFYCVIVAGGLISFTYLFLKEKRRKS